MNEIIVEATIENIGKVIDYVDGHLEELSCPLKIRTQFKIAIDEIISNISQYAYSPDTGKVSVSVEIIQEPLSVIISFMDDGVQFDPLQLENPDITLSAEERAIGGLGIYMVKKSMDEVFYEYKNSKNILTIRKNIEPA